MWPRPAKIEHARWIYPVTDDDADDVTCGCFGCLGNYPSYAAVLSFRRDLKRDNITFTAAVVKMHVIGDWGTVEWQATELRNYEITDF